MFTATLVIYSSKSAVNRMNFHLTQKTFMHTCFIWVFQLNLYQYEYLLTLSEYKVYLLHIGRPNITTVRMQNRFCFSTHLASGC